MVVCGFTLALIQYYEDILTGPQKLNSFKVKTGSWGLYVCVCGCALSTRPHAIIEVFGSSKASGSVHSQQSRGVKGHHLDYFSYLETSPLALIEVTQRSLKASDP